MKDSSYHFCEKCGNLVKDGGGECCGVKMKQIFEGREGSPDKHTPVVTVGDNSLSVSVGKDGHPMTKEHLVEWVYLKTDKGRYIKYLHADEEPRVTFSLSDESPIEVSAYCNKHGLWRKELG